MATTIQQIESAPASYPALPYSTDTYPAYPVDEIPAAITAIGDTAWQRIEAYTAYRYTARNVVWVVEGPGEWHPPLAPATVSTVEIWSRRAEEWETTTLNASPLGGYWLPCSGPYRFTASVGAGTVPESINEAFRRLAAYLTADPGKPGATFDYMSIGGGSLMRRVERDAAWMAKALQNSGAADLLRTFRKAP